MVIPPAKTGRERISKMAVKKTVQTNNGSISHVISGKRRLMIVQRKLMELPILDAPDT
jgi:hypothetical protein